MKLVPGSFIPGTRDQLDGLKKGDATDVDVTFPETYFVKELAGKEAVFKVNIQKLSTAGITGLTDEYVAANTDVKTVADLRLSTGNRWKLPPQKTLRRQKKRSDRPP